LAFSDWSPGEEAAEKIRRGIIRIAKRGGAFDVDSREASHNSDEGIGVGGGSRKKRGEANCRTARLGEEAMN